MQKKISQYVYFLCIHNTSNYTDSYCKYKTTQNHKNNNNYSIRALKV